MIFRRLLARSWKYLWQSRLLWLFVASAVIPYWIIPDIRSSGQYVLSGEYICLLLPITLLLAFISVIGNFGIIRCVYVLSQNGVPSLVNTWAPVRTNLVRLFATSMIAVLFSFPLAIMLFFGISLILRVVSSHPLGLYSAFYLFVMLLAFLVNFFGSIFVCTVLIENKGVLGGIRHGLNVVLIGKNLEVLLATNLIQFALGLLPGLVTYAVIFWLRVGFSDNVIQMFSFDSYYSIARTTAYIVITRAAGLVTLPLGSAAMTLAYLECIRDATPALQPPAP